MHRISRGRPVPLAAALASLSLVAGSLVAVAPVAVPAAAAPAPVLDQALARSDTELSETS
jgi:hypothetical protein